jgi:ATP-dependent DNA ligase
MPRWIEPMKATLTKDRFLAKGLDVRNPNWMGYAAWRLFQPGQVRLLSPQSVAMNETYPEVVGCTQETDVGSVILDGEIVAFRASIDVTSLAFSSSASEFITQRKPVTRRAVYFYVFDLLYAQGRDYARPAARASKTGVGAIDSILIRSSGIRRNVIDRGEAYYREACRLGWEGLIAKRRD